MTDYFREALRAVLKRNIPVMEDPCNSNINKILSLLEAIKERKM